MSKYVERGELELQLSAVRSRLDAMEEELQAAHRSIAAQAEVNGLLTKEVGQRMDHFYNDIMGELRRING